MAQHTIFHHIPQLQDDFCIPLYTKLGKSLDNVNAWLGTAGTVTACHFDTYDNLFAQARRPHRPGPSHFSPRRGSR